MERWSREKRNHLRLDLDNAQRILKESKSSDNIRKQNYANMKFEQKWHQYNNDIAELEHKKHMTLLQAKNEYSPSLSSGKVILPVPSLMLNLFSFQYFPREPSCPYYLRLVRLQRPSGQYLPWDSSGVLHKIKISGNSGANRASRLCVLERAGR